MVNLQMETTNRCNLQCQECPNRMMKRKRMDMNSDVFDIILNDYIRTDGFDTIILHKDGEPLLHSHLKTMIREISHVSNAKIDIYTNGMLLKQEFIEFLTSIHNKVWVLVSFHFYDYKGGMYDYQPVTEELMRIVEMDHKNVDLVFASHVTDAVDHEELLGWQEAWSEFVDPEGMLNAVHVNTAINPWTGLIEQKNCIAFDSCPYMDGQHLFIGVTGNVIPCCMDLEEEIVFGNVADGRKDTVMNDREEFYQSLRDGKVKEDVCRRCLSL